MKGHNLQGQGNHNNSVIRVAYGGHAGLCGIAVWCHASDTLRRASMTVDAGGHLHARQVEDKCECGLYSSGVQVHRDGHLLMHTCSVRCCTGESGAALDTVHTPPPLPHHCIRVLLCLSNSSLHHLTAQPDHHLARHHTSTGSGIIIFGSGTLQDTTLCDNSFNGVEVQKGARGSLIDCHIHSNGYSNNDDDLGSGVTVYGDGSEANLRRFVGPCCRIYYSATKSSP